MLAYKFRLYPNKEEERKLLWTKEVCRKTCERFLDPYYAGERDRFQLQALLPVWKESDAYLRGVHPKVLHYELHRSFANIKALNEMKDEAARSASFVISLRSGLEPSLTIRLDSNCCRRTKSSASCTYRR